jgi:putative Holliday junction resolvase
MAKNKPQCCPAHRARLAPNTRARHNGAMISQDIAEFATALPASGRVIGLDLGSKTIGLALSDPGRMIATPMETIRRGKFTKDAATLDTLMNDHEVVAMVLGLPINMDGSEGPRAQSTRAFARNMEQRREMPCLLWDERLSTTAVTRTLIEADMSRKRRAEVVDKMAAGFILQGALDALAQR